MNLKTMTCLNFVKNEKESNLFLPNETTYGELYDIGCEISAFAGKKMMEVEEQKKKVDQESQDQTKAEEPKVESIEG